MSQPQKPLNGQMTASSSRPHLKSTTRWVVLSGAAVLVTLAAFAWASYMRRIIPELPPPPPENIPIFDPYAVGLMFHLTLVPIALIYLFSSTALVQRVVSGKVAPRDTAKLFAGLALILLLTYGYNLGFSRLAKEPPHLRLNSLVMVTGGLLGGWKVGLGLGLITMLFRGMREWFYVAPEWIRDSFLILRNGHPADFLRMLWEGTLLPFYVANPWAILVVWSGIISGLFAELLGKHRFTPLAALVLGAGTDLGLGLLHVVAGPLGWQPLLVANILVSGFAMAVIALIVRGVQGEAARHEAAAAELARTRAELRALRAQINPHFLFNAINTIRYFVRTDSEAARRLLLNLSEIFQRALRSGESVPLRDELSYVEAYLALEKARLGERLQVAWSVQAETWLEHPVPTLILQPIVENAVIHGIARKGGGGTVRITVGQVGNDLMLQVEDDGPGIPPARLREIQSPEAGDESIGLRNVDGRLRTLYGEDYRLLVQSEVGRGTHVQIRIPIEL